MKEIKGKRGVRERARTEEGTGGGGRRKTDKGAGGGAGAKGGVGMQ